MVTLQADNRHSQGEALMRSTNLAFAAMAALTLAAAAQAAPVTKADIQAQNDKFGAAIRAGNGAAVAALYAGDATILPAGAPQLSGQPAIKAYWTQAVAGVADATLTAVDVQPLGTLYAREIGTYALKTKGSPSQTISGKYVVVWKHEGGAWKLWTDIWNASQ
jgi:uncharacterized protein (TIGR02246 family)